jgi:hypothetical protein
MVFPNHFLLKLNKQKIRSFALPDSKKAEELFVELNLIGPEIINSFGEFT